MRDKQKQNKFLIGKLKHEFLQKMLNDFVSTTHLKEDRVVVGSSIGEDAAVIDMGDKYLVAKTDPITFVTDEIGYYAVNINTDEDLIETIFRNIHDTCKSLGITVIGGHTEITAALDRPIVIGSLLGEVDKEKLVLSSGAKEDDIIILTKGIFIEGTSIIAREKEDFLKEKGYGNQFIEKCKNYLYDPGISIFKEAVVSNDNFTVTSMHDLTEGGLFNGLAEIAIASNLGLLIKKEQINVLPEPLELSKIFNIDPCSTISSGSLLISINPKFVEDLINLLAKNGIASEAVGRFTKDKHKYLILDENNREKTMIYTEVDEITKIV